jgi:3-oxoadipate enol-lactonase
MHVLDIGPSGAPAVLLLHGSPVPAGQLARLAAALGRDHRVLLPDLPGYGDSPPIPTSLRETYSAIEAQLRALGVGAVDLVGISLGGYRALGLALRRAVTVRRIVTVGAFGGLSREERGSYAALAAALRGGETVADVLIERAFTRRYRLSHPDSVARCRLWIRDVAADTFAADLDDIAASEDLRPRIGGLRASLLALHGLSDGFFPPVKSQEIIAAARQARLELLPCGHLALDELPEETTARIRRFLSADL